MSLKVVVDNEKALDALLEQTLQDIRKRGLDVEILTAPEDPSYTVPRPFVSYESGTTTLHAYGNDALNLIKRVASGEI